MLSTRSNSDRDFFGLESRYQVTSYLLPYLGFLGFCAGFFRLLVLVGFADFLRFVDLLGVLTCLRLPRGSRGFL